MKKRLTFVLALLFVFACCCSACAPASEPDNGATQQIETPEKPDVKAEASSLFEQVAGAFAARTAYRQVTNVEGDGKPRYQGDLTVEGVGRESYCYSGWYSYRMNPSEMHSQEVYGKGSDRFTYVKETNNLTFQRILGGQESEFYESRGLYPGMILDVFSKDLILPLISDNVEISEWDGVTTLKIPLTRNQAVLVLGGNASYEENESAEESAECYLLYEIGADSLPRKVEFRAKYTGMVAGGHNLSVTKDETYCYEYSYGSAVSVSAWFNEADPFGAMSSGSVSYISEDNSRFWLENFQGRAIVDFSSDPAANVIEIPDITPLSGAMLSVPGTITTKNIIVKSWDDSISYFFQPYALIFVKETERPAGNTQQYIYYKGEWEMKDGIPVAKGQ